MKKLLIVEDDIYLLNLFKETLSTEGYQIELAEDGQQALEKVEQFQPEIMLLDLMLPYVDGFKVLEEVRANPAHKDTKIVIVTNLDSEMQRKKAKTLGADKFLVKSDKNPGNIIDELKEFN